MFYCTMSDTNELYHYGVKGMKWGVRRNRQNENYTDTQRKRDRALYGERGEKRINRKMNKGHGVQGARHYEVKRREQKEKAKRAVKKGVRAAAAAASTIGTLYIYDQAYNSGRGTKAVKAGVKAAGRAVVTAYMKARGGTDIRWYV